MSWFRCAPGVALALGFTDVQPGDDYSEAIADLSDQGIINGFTDGTFRPGELVTRQQFAKMIVLTLGLPVTEDDICPFSDVERSGSNSLYPDNYVAVCAATASPGARPTTPSIPTATSPVPRS